MWYQTPVGGALFHMGGPCGVCGRGRALPREKIGWVLRVTHSHDVLSQMLARCSHLLPQLLPTALFPRPCGHRSAWEGGFAHGG